jgi:NTP pyrophosphatase (non-canonical NTP hydrolase)
MNKILKKQIEVQKLLADSMVTGYIVPPHYMMNVTVGDKYHTISSMQTFLNQEVDELLIELGDGTRDIHKPWKKKCHIIKKSTFESDPDIRGEAIDVLCFALNICIAAGITPENIEDEYNEVYDKILRRIENGN